MRKIAKLLFDRGHKDLAVIVAKISSVYLQLSDISDSKERQRAKDMLKKGFKFVLLEPKPIYKKTLEEFTDFSKEEFFNVQELVEDLKVASKLRVDALRDRINVLKVGNSINTYTQPNFKITKTEEDRIKWESGSNKGEGFVLDLVDAMEQAGIRFVS